MKVVAYSVSEHISLSCGERFNHICGLKRQELFPDITSFCNSFLCSLQLKTSLLNADYLDRIGADVIIFLSKHSSSAGISSFTVHALGNWSNQADYGGAPMQLSVSSPLLMQKLLAKIFENNKIKDITTTYEATHHGPLLKTPCFFVEWGGPSSQYDYGIEIIVSSVKEAIESDQGMQYDKIVVGIGGGHYATKFTKLAIDSKYAFAHIMPRFHINVDLLEQAFLRSKPKAEIAVIECKGIKSADREKLIKKIDELGFDHVKI